MARVPYLTRDDLEPRHRDAWDEIAAGRGVVGPNFQALFNAPEATARLASWGACLRFDADIPPRLKELAILCAAREADCDYVWTAHERLARQRGVAEPIIAAIRDRGAPAGLAGDDATVAGFARSLLIDHAVPDATFAAARRLLGNRGVVELTQLTLYYFALSLSLRALEVELPQGMPSTL